MMTSCRSLLAAAGRAGLGLVVLGGLSGAVLAGPPRFLVTELPTLGGAESVGVAINNAGLISGESNRPNEGYHVATAWLPSDYRPVYLTGSGGSVATAPAVNDAGVIVGVSDILPLGAYSAAPPSQPAATLDQMNMHWGLPAGINLRGDVCGSWSGVQMQGAHPFVILDGVFAALPVLEGGFQGAAAGVNINGIAVGWSEQGPNGGYIRAAKWEHGAVVQLASGDSMNSANAINGEGWIVGYTSDPSQPQYVAALWTDAQTRIDLGRIVPTHWQHMAYAINNRRQIVGTSGQHAFLWENGVMRDLETLIPAGSGWIFYAANGLNDRGQIVGEGLHNGVVRGFLLTPRCPADFDGDGSVAPADIAGFVSLWFSTLPSGSLAGDFDGNGRAEPADIAAFVNAWFAALGNGC